MTKFKLAAIFISLACGPALLAATISDQVKARQANFKQISRANKAINDELKKSAPSIVVLRANAAALEKASLKVTQNLPKGSFVGSTVKTEARSEILQKPAIYKSKAAEFQKAAKALRLAAAAGKLPQIKTAAAAMGPTCKGCHESFRAKD